MGKSCAGRWLQFLHDPELEVRLALLEPLLDVFLTCIALPVGFSGGVLVICKEVSLSLFQFCLQTNSDQSCRQGGTHKQNALQPLADGFLPIDTYQLLFGDWSLRSKRANTQPWTNTTILWLNSTSRRNQMIQSSPEGIEDKVYFMSKIWGLTKDLRFQWLANCALIQRVKPEIDEMQTIYCPNWSRAAHTFFTYDTPAALPRRWGTMITIMLTPAWLRSSRT